MKKVCKDFEIEVLSYSRVNYFMQFWILWQQFFCFSMILIAFCKVGSLFKYRFEVVLLCLNWLFYIFLYYWNIMSQTLNIIEITSMLSLDAWIYLEREWTYDGMTLLSVFPYIDFLSFLGVMWWVRHSDWTVSGVAKKSKTGLRLF